MIKDLTIFDSILILIALWVSSTGLIHWTLAVVIALVIGACFKLWAES